MKDDQQIESPLVHRPAKRFGQNFLVDQRVIERIIEAVDPLPTETIIEIGPGKGALTAPLLERAGRLVAIEFDRQLVPFLSDAFAEHENFHLVQSDALEADFSEVIQPARSARLVANLPYNISTAILQHLISQRSTVTELVVMLQREVVERITAEPGSSERGFLSVIMQAYAEIDRLIDVAPGSFRPSPKVWSSVIRVRWKTASVLRGDKEKLFWDVVSAGFAQRRKTMLNNLRSAKGELQERIKSCGGASIILCQADIELQRRAETLTFDEWLRIVDTMS